MFASLRINGSASNVRLAVGWLAMLLLLLPLATLLVLAASSWFQVDLDLRWLKLAGRTIALGAGASFLAVVWGVAAAWLIEMCVFPGRRLLGLLLFLPFAIPPYLQAYIWGDLIDSAAWAPAGFGMRNIYGASFVMSLALYPYVYMLARATFASRSCTLLAIARMLGCSPLVSFFKVALPMARPAIVIGALLVFMEVTNDIAVAQNYGIRTLGSHIYDLWLNRDQRGAAIAVSSLLLIIAFVIFAAELASRAKQRQYDASQNYFCCTDSFVLPKPHAALALIFCGVLIAASFFLPTIILLLNTLSSQVDARSLLGGVTDTLYLVVGVCALGFAIGSAVAGLLRSIASPHGKLACQFAMAGYALPGVVYSLGMLIFIGYVADKVFDVSGISIHWLWITSSALLLVALAFRYVVIPVGAVDSALSSIPPQLGAAGRLAGKSSFQMLRRFWLPLMRPTLIAGALLLATDIIKELPLTLILRPFEFNPLAILIYQFASDEDIYSASPYALVLVVLTACMLALSYRWIVPAWMSQGKAAT